MAWPTNAETFLSWWDETELPRLRASIAADPTNRALVTDLAHAEKGREVTYRKVSDAYDRECEAEYARQGNTCDETIFDTMSGGTIVR